MTVFGCGAVFQLISLVSAGDGGGSGSSVPVPAETVRHCDSRSAALTKEPRRPARPTPLPSSGLHEWSNGPHSPLSTERYPLTVAARLIPGTGQLRRLPRCVRL